MPSPYTGNPGAAQSPSPAPVAGSPPIIEVPIDTDPPNAATFAQGYKAPADYIAFLQNPFGNPSAWSQPVWKGSKDAKGNKRWELDHWGLPRRAMLSWDEDFAPASAFNVVGAQNVRTSLPIIGGSGSYAVGRQRIVTVGAGCFTTSQSPAVAYSNPPMPAVLAGTVAPNAHRQFAASIDGNAPANRAEMRLDDDFATSVFDVDTLISCEWDFYNFTNDAVLWVLGFCGSGEFVNSIANGLFFIRPNTAGANWKARSIQHGTQTEQDTGVLAGPGGHTFRIDFAGSQSADDSTARALFWIDGTLVANITTNLPSGYGSLAIPTAGGVTQVTGGGPYPTIFMLNGIRYRQISNVALV